jgi:hypothetical protein
MKETAQLRASIDALYRTFAEYPLRADTNACLCCHSSSDEKRLHLKPLQNLSAGDLRQYANDALFVWGDIDDFKHFLPRIFELLVAQGDSFVDPQVALGKLYLSSWQSWADLEQRCLRGFLKTLWDCVLDTEPSEPYGMEVEGWLCALAQFEPQLSAYLKAWLATETDNARLNLAAFIDYFGVAGQQPSGYWSDRVELFDEVTTWIRSEAVKVSMTKVAADYPQHGFVERAFTSLP